MLRDKDCKTALEVAEQFNKYETAQLLRDHAAAPAAAQPSCSRRICEYVVQTNKYRAETEVS